MFTSLLLCTDFTLKGQVRTVTYQKQPNIEYQLRNENRPAVRERVTKRLKQNAKDYILIMDGEQSYFALNSNKSTGSGLSLVEVKAYFKDKDLNELLMDINIQDSSYIIKDKLDLFQISAKDEYKDILGYKCQAFEAKFQKEIYTFWVTDNADFIAGPAEFHTSEGAILQVDALSYSYVATSIGISDKIIPTKAQNVNMKLKKMNYTDFKKKVEAIKASIEFNSMFR